MAELAGCRTALLWDESFLWGVMAYKALRAASLDFDLISSEDIRKGILGQYKLLFVPGGWASNKIKALGTDGTLKIKDYVNSGGNYLGFCGGAGLATLDGLGLLDIKRKPTKERVPSFSGKVKLNFSGHPIWKGIKEPVFHAWWPSQFMVEGNGCTILASYGNALPDSFSSDLNTGDIEANGNWAEMEQIYNINLNPRRLLNEPAVVEGTFGKGKVLLSLLHFDTPDDSNGAIVLKNIWSYLGLATLSPDITPGGVMSGNNISDVSEFVAIESEVDELIALGIRNFLWFWRNSMLLQWRRGVRGLEYCSLHIMINELVQILRGLSPVPPTATRANDIEIHTLRIKELLVPFTEKAKRLLILERNAMQNGHITYEKCDNPEIQEIRTKLFSGSKSHGGLFKELIDEVAALLYSLLK
jgi:hypothetical protein